MKKVYQKVLDQNVGDYMQAVMASLFDKDMKDVPEFIKMGQNWFKSWYKFLQDNGYDYVGMKHNANYNRLCDPTRECKDDVKFHAASMMKPKSLHKYKGIDGYFYAAVFSPKYFSFEKQTTHAVIIDRDYNIVHDPNRGYKDLLAYPLTSLLKYNGIINVYLIEKI